YNTPDKGTRAALPGPSTLALRTNSLATLSNAELLNLQSHPNEWYARHARRILQERSLSGAELNSIKSETLSRYDAQADIPLKLRLLFVLHAIGGDSQSWLTGQLQNADYHIRSWAVRFLAESGAQWEELVPLFTKAAVEDPSPAVRLELASALQRIPA